MGQRGKQPWGRAARFCASTFLLTLIVPFLAHASTANACEQPDIWSVASAFDVAANGLLPVSYPQLPPNGPRAVPPSLLKAVGWVESGWREFRQENRPLVSFDFGYGIMQITSGMNDAYGDPSGDLDPATQSRIASDAQYNIAYGAMILASKWNATPMVGNGDPASIEDWYYALWAYNGWGWQNNPSNPRFTRHGTPATDPRSFPYQERVLYFVAHPPHDPAGNPLWAAVPVSLPSHAAVGKHPGALVLKQTHRQPPAALSAIYDLATVAPFQPGAVRILSVSLRNTGLGAWPASGAIRTVLSYRITPANSSGAAPVGIDRRTRHGAVPLPRLVTPGNWYTLRVKLTAPSTPGKYTIVWDLRQWNGVTFSELGIPPGREPLDVTRSGSSSSPTPTPSPTASMPPEGLSYVTDTSMPDGTSVTPGQAFMKGWLVFNDGTQGWQSTWSLQRIGGTSMGITRVTVPTTPPCRSANILVAQHAPMKPGTYRESWQLADAQGHRVGDMLTVRIKVRSKTAGTPGPTPPPGTPTPIPRGPTPTTTPVG